MRTTFDAAFGVGGGHVADTQSTTTGLQWLQILIGGGIAGLATSLATTRIEWRRLKNEEGEKSSYYEQQLFTTRLQAYQRLASDLSNFGHGLLDAIQDAPDPWSWADRAAIGDSIEGTRVAVTRDLMEMALLFGPAMDDPLGMWVDATNYITGRTNLLDSPVGANEAYAHCLYAQYAVLQAMRSDLHLGDLDRSLVDKLAGASNKRIERTP